MHRLQRGAIASKRTVRRSLTLAVDCPYMYCALSSSVGARMSRWTAGPISLLAAAVLVILPAGAGRSSDARAVDECDRRCAADLRMARVATQKYWEVSAALADGFVEASGCETTPEGAVGFVYQHLARGADQRVEVERPESLLYVPEGVVGTGRRLVGLQYSVSILEEGQVPPELFGRRFDGPVAGPLPGVGAFRLRVWLFSDAPGGLFAWANSAEACDAEGTVTPDAVVRGVCHEVAAIVPVRAATVRRVGRVPPEIRLRGENEDGSGDTALSVGAFSCEHVVLRDGTAIEDLLFAETVAPVYAPDWEGPDDLGSSRWLIRVVYSSRRYAGAQREAMGIGTDVVGYSPNVVSGFEPTVGRTGSYSFTSPEFALRATVTDTVPSLRPYFLRIWRDGTRGMGYYHVWVKDLTIGPAVIEVSPEPRTPLGQMVGCNSAATSCPSIRASGSVVTFGGAVRMTAQDEWWNPRDAA